MPLRNLWGFPSVTDFEFEIMFGTEAGMGWDSERQWDAIIVAAAAMGPSCPLYMIEDQDMALFLDTNISGVVAPVVVSHFLLLLWPCYSLSRRQTGVCSSLHACRVEHIASSEVCCSVERVVIGVHH